MSDLAGATPGPLPRRVGLEPTGDAGVDATMSRLSEMEPGTDPAAQLPVLVQVHEELQRRMTAAEA